MTFSGIIEKDLRMLNVWGKKVLCHGIKENHYINHIKDPHHKKFFHKTSYISALMFKEWTQTFTTQQTTAGGDHKSPCAGAECLTAHYTVGRNFLQALHCLTWWSYITAASQQVREVWSDTSLNLQHLSKPPPCLVEGTHSKPKITALNCLNFLVLDRLWLWTQGRGLINGPTSCSIFRLQTLEPNWYVMVDKAVEFPGIV